MRLLVVAYACDPERGSEPGVGWHICRRLAEYHDVWVVTRRKNRGPIERALELDPAPRLSVEYHDLDWAMGLKSIIPGSVYPYHYLWQMTVIKRIRKFHEGSPFDIAHALTLGSFRFPSSLYRLDIPLVIGPLGGLEEVPVRFWGQFGLRGILKEGLRWLSNRIARVDPWVRRTLESADVVFAASDDGKRALSELFRLRSDARTLPSIGIGSAQMRAFTSPSDSKLRLLFVGRLEHWKGAHLAISGLAEARRRGVDASLTILGSGPFESSLRRRTRRAGIDSSINWIRSLPTLDDVAALYSEHDVLVFPSLHESGGMVAIEAMSAGLPIVCVGIGGPAVTVTPETGFMIDATTPDEVVEGIAAAILRLDSDRDLRRSMGQAARTRVATEYTWEHKVARLIRTYGELL